MDRLSFYKSFYDKEIERRDTLSNSVSVIVAILTALFAGAFILATKYKYESQSYLDYLFVILVFSNLIVLFLSSYFLIKSLNNVFRGNDYLEIAFLSEIEQYYQDHLEFTRNVKLSNNELKDYMLDELITYTDNNSEINTRRYFELYRCKNFVILSLVLLLLTSLIFWISNCL